VVGKWEEFIIPLQGILASMIIFTWLCKSLNIETYTLFPDIKTITFIFIISFFTHKLAIYAAEHIGTYLDELYDREGFKIFVFRGIILIMQSPVIFIFGLYLGKQLTH
jgi:hypothetical protein